nr:tRNA pseudouridine(54/55) synthase Pus10 [Candidatus Njordarchaeum guaymaensis]
MEITEKALRILEQYPLCDSCLGRQFALLGVDLDNRTRGRALKNALTMWSHSLVEIGNSREDAIRTLKVLALNGNYRPALKTLEKLGIIEENPNWKCFICSNTLEDLDELAKIGLEALEGLEFRTFLVGSVIPPQVIEREDGVRSKAGSNWCEALKREVNREIGKRLRETTGKEPDFDSPDVTLFVDPFNKKVTVKLNPLFVSGRYRKLVRGIPQATWLCKKCKGSGCPDCNWSGRMYETSVQDFLCKPLLGETGGVECKFHGAGREDVDARMLGNGRPFIVEIKEPRRRFIDLSEVTRRISEYSEGRVEVSGLKLSSRDDLRKIKTRSATTEKTYKAIVTVEKDVNEEDVRKLSDGISGAIIKQRTPLRVLHRRADRVRLKKVYDLRIKIVTPKQMEIVVKTQGGLYVKELVTGDNGRTTPSFSEVLNTKAECNELDVIDVAEQLG